MDTYIHIFLCHVIKSSIPRLHIIDQLIQYWPNNGHHLFMRSYNFHPLWTIHLYGSPTDENYKDSTSRQKQFLRLTVQWIFQYSIWVVDIAIGCIMVVVILYKPSCKFPLTLHDLQLMTITKTPDTDKNNCSGLEQNYSCLITILHPTLHPFCHYCTKYTIWCCILLR